MTTFYFGERWGVPALDNAEQVATPVGVPCIWCEHEIQDGERGYMRPHWSDDPGEIQMLPSHRGCELASSVGHLFKVCSCTGFDDYWDRNVELEQQQVWGSSG